MRPHPSLLARYAARGALLWIGARLLAGAVIALAGGHPVFLDLSSASLMIPVCIVLGLADIARRHERALLENLGVSLPARIAFFAVPALTGEALVAILGGIVQ